MTELSSAPLHAIVRPPETVTETAHVARMLWLRTLFGQAVEDRDEDALPIEPLAQRMTEFFIPRGAPLYEEGTTSDSLFFLVEGSIRQGTRGYTLFVPGDVLGFIDAMIDRPHRHSSVVEEDAVILRLRIDDWLEYLEDHFEAVKGLIESTLRNFGDHPHDGLPRPELGIALANLSSEAGSPSGEFVRRLLALHSCPLLERASIQALAQMLRRSVLRELRAGEPYPAHNRPGIWIVVRGKIKLRTACADGTRHVLVQGPGALLHSLHTLREIPEVFELTAQENAELLYLSSSDFFDVLEDHFDVARSALSYLARRLDDVNRSRAKGIPHPELAARPASSSTKRSSPRQT